MRRHLIIAAGACAMLIAFASVAQATIISGAWSVSVTAWGACVPACPLPTVPANASAEISFDNGIIYSNALVPAANYSTNFGSDITVFSYSPSLDQLEFIFDTSNGALVADFDAASSASPTATLVRWRVVVPSSAIADASSFNATFTPASTAVPEPSALLLLLVGLGGGLIRRAPLRM
jgi:hypothetical protein